MIEFVTHLHTDTLLIIATLVMALTLGATWILWSMSPSEPYLRRWTAGYGLICAGLALGAAREHLFSFIAIVVGNSLIAMGGVLIVNGIACYCRQERGYWPVGIIGAVIFALFYILLYLYPSLRLRVILISTLFMAICLRLTWLLWVRAPAGTGFICRILGSLTAFQSLFYMMGISSLLVPAATQNYSDAPAAYNSLYLNAIVMFICLLFGFTGLTHRRLQLTLEHTAHHDALTGALNRHALDTVLEDELAQQQGRRGELSIVMMDLDHFKSLNDRFGHAIGDTALQLFAEAARSNLRQNDVLARTGGEEFCLILPRTDSATAAGVAERLRQVVERIEIPAAPAARLTVSAGVATASGKQQGTTAAMLLKTADDALYTAKHQGRNRVVIGV